MTAQILEIHNLIKRYDSTEALKGIDLSVSKGSIFGVIGMSGAGKSTLIRCLTCLEDPSEGKIILHGKKMGMIFQHFNLFSSRNALENVAYPLEIEGISRSERHCRAKELLRLVNLEGKEHHYPIQLSGGEKQRVAIARALANKPDLLLCDEATSALDPRTTQSILQLLTRLNEELNLTILLITHEMEVIKQICTHVAVLEQGEIVEQGEVADLFAAPKHSTTRRFLQNLSHEAPCCAMKGGKLVRLSFKGESAGEPIISELMRTYHVEINILAGGIDHLRKEAVGNLIVEITGSVESQEKACAFLQEKGVVCNELE